MSQAVPLVFLLALTDGACAPPRGPCAPEAELAEIEAQYQAELVDKCVAFLPADPPEQCPDYTAVTEKYRRMREDWAACRR